jgi:uncharacterized protein
MNEPLHYIRYPVAVDQHNGKLMEEKEYALHVRQLMLQVLFTNPGERVNRPDFGCGIRRMVFAPNSDATASLTQILIMESMNKWLSEVITVETVEVSALQEKLEIRISYILKVKLERQFLNVTI